MAKHSTLVALAGYLCWAVFPIYFKQLQGVPALQVLAHRVVWSFIILSILLALRGEWRTLFRGIGKPRLLIVSFVAAVLLAINWLIYIWAVNAGYIVEASLGYFINPLVNILLGVVFLRERLRPTQWLSVSLAGLGVAYLAISYGKLPLIALGLAFSFGFYGLLKKTASLGSLHGLSLETGLIFAPALAGVLFSEGQGLGAFGHGSLSTSLLLIGAGIMTTVPLLLFGSAARSIPLSTMGLLQYVHPTGQFLIGVLIYHEPFGLAQLVGFGIIWAALAMFWIENYCNRRRLRLTAPVGVGD